MRYTVEIPSKLHDVFKSVALAENISLSELMRRSILTYCVLHKEQQAGKAVVITKNGIIEKELLLTF